MTPSLFPDLARREKKSGRVPATSVEQYRRVDAKGRAQAVLQTLSHWLRVNAPPTSAELSGWFYPGGMAEVLYVRRGLSDLLALGAVEHGPSRTCRVSGRTCVTWRVKSR